MSEPSISLSVIQGKHVLASVSSSAGQPERVQAVGQARYLLTGLEDGAAPQNVTLKRVGKDLHLSLEDSGAESPRLIIEDFYEHPGEVVGMAADGEVYPYVAVDGGSDGELAPLLDSASAPHILGGDALSGFMADLSTASGFPWIKTLSALGAAAAVALLWPDKGGKSTSPPPPAPSLEAVRDENGDEVAYVAPGSLTANSTPTLSGLSVANTQVEIVVAGVSLGVVPVDAAGQWTYTPTAALADGHHQFSVFAIDGAGRRSDAASTYDIEIDATPPVEPLIQTLTDQAGSLTLSGSAEAGSLLTIYQGTGAMARMLTLYQGSEALGSVRVGADGQWTFTVPAGAQGAHEFYATATDRAGNVSAPSTGFESTPPAAPVISHALDDQGSIKGQIAHRDATDDTTPTLVGSGEPLSVVHIYVNGGATPIGSVQVAASGSWTFPVPAQLEGNYSFTATATSAAGLVSPVSGGFDIDIDLTAPDSPNTGPGGQLGEAYDDVPLITGPIVDGSVTNDNRPNFGGEGMTPYDLVFIYDNGALIGSAQVTSDGDWAWTPPPCGELADGPHVITVAVRDPVGNLSPPSYPYTFEVDTSIPAATPPVITHALDDQGALQANLANGAVTDDTTPTLMGTGEANSIVHLYVTGTTRPLGSAQVQPDGTWTFSLPRQPQGVHDYYAKSTDWIGQVSAPSSDFRIEIDTTAPLAPLITHALDDQGSLEGHLVDGDATDDSTPTLVGTGEPLSVVRIYLNGATTPIGSVQVAADGSWTFPVPAQVEGSHTFTATATDAAGLISPVSGGFDIEIDLTTPNPPVIVSAEDNEGPIQDSLNSGDVTDDTTPTLRGTGEADSLLHIYAVGTREPLGSVLVQPNGTWTFTVPAQAEGCHEFYAIATDRTGNVSPHSSRFAITIDTAPPAPPTPPAPPSITHALDDLLGNLASGTTTHDTTPTLVGTGEWPGVVHIYMNNGTTPIGSALILRNGGWTFSVPAQSEGNYTFTATAINGTGGVSPVSGAFDIEIDLTAPNPPVIVSAEDNEGPIQDSLNSGDVTDDTTPTLRGTGEADSLLHIYAVGTREPLGSVLVQPNGTWTFTVPAQAEGCHEFYAIATDRTGNVSPHSSRFAITIDTAPPAPPTPPAPPSITHALDDLLGNLASGTTTHDTTPTLVGTGEWPGVVHIYMNNGTTPIGSALILRNGGWTFSVPAQSEGNYTFTATAINGTGGVSPVSGAFDIEIDLTAPNPPVIVSAEDNEGAIRDPLESGDVTDDVTPTLVGTGEANSIVHVYVTGTPLPLGSAQVQSDGTWTLTLPIQPQGAHDYYATSTDRVGHVSTPSSDFRIDIDTAVTLAPVITHAHDDQGSLEGNLDNGDATDDTTPTLKGTGEANSIVHIYVTGTTLPLGSAQVQLDGTWTFTVPARAEGPHAFYATATDRVGNVSPESNGFDLRIDTTPPVAPTITHALDEQGGLQCHLVDGDATGDTTPTLVGSGEPLSVVHIYVNGGATPIGSVQVAADGSWTFPVPVQAEGKHTFTATATDAVGLISTVSGTFDIEIDLTAPNPPVILSALDDVGSNQGALASGDVTDDVRPTLTGTGEANSIVHLYVTGTAISLGSAQVQTDGTWTFSVPARAEGAYEFYATATDRSGNVSVQSTGFDLAIDTTPPAAPVITHALDDQGSVQDNLASGAATDDTTPTLIGTGEVGSLIHVYVVGVTEPLGSAQVQPDGTWTFSVPARAEGTYEFYATATDRVGNLGAESKGFDLTIETTAPAAPVITHALDDQGSVKGQLAHRDATDDTTPTLVGTGEPLGVVHIYVNGGASPIGSAQVAANGSWTFSVPALLEGNYTFTATAANAAGPVSGGFDIDIDLTAPDRPNTGPGGQLGEAEAHAEVPLINGPIVDGSATNDNRPTFGGAGMMPHDLVFIHDNGVLIGSALVTSDGTWAWTPSDGDELADGFHAITVTARDPVGNLSPESEPYTFEVDTQSPAAKAVIQSMSKDSGANSADFVTNDGSAGRLVQGTLTAALAAGETVQVSVDGGTTWQAALIDGNTWQFVDQSDHRGSWIIQTRVIDAGGNATTDEQLVLLDTTAPGTPPTVKADIPVGIVTVALGGTRAVAGDIVKIEWGDYRIDHVLTAGQVSANLAAITIPADIRAAAPNPSDVAAALVDAQGNSSMFREHSNARFTDFEDARGQLFALSTPVEHNGLRFTATAFGPNATGPVGIVDGFLGAQDGNATWRLGVRGDMRIDLLDGPSTSISMRISHYQGTQSLGYDRTTLIFYSADGAVLDTVLLPSTGTINAFYYYYTMPGGQEFASFEVRTGVNTHNSSGIRDWIAIDNIELSGGAGGGIHAPAVNQTVELISDAYQGSTTDDTFSMAQVDYFLNAGSGIHGGAGADTIRLTGMNQILDLSNLAGKVSSIETIDLTGSGDNTLRLSIHDVFNQGDMNLFHDSGKVQMLVKGNAGDSVDLDDLVAGATSSDWASAGQVTLAGVVYEVYQHNSLDAELLVQNGVTTHLV
jgi:P pilus assembly chaperone PapD